MKNNWNDTLVDELNNDLLKLRVYSSQLLGQEEDLVLHGGGNTSVKVKETNKFGEQEDILYVKGSGWNLGTIKAEGFAPVKLEMLLKLANLDDLTDPEMVKYQRMAMTNPSAPNPSVEAILHAIIPYTFVDHTHADAVVTITNTPDGSARIKNLYGSKILVIPYVMPGFILAKEIHTITKDLDWSTIDGMILMNHGVFTFHDNPKVSYTKMIQIVSQAEQYLEEQEAVDLGGTKKGVIKPLEIATLRKNVSDLWGIPILAHLNNSESSTSFSNLDAVHEIANRGPLTPDHIIRTKRAPLILTENHKVDLDIFVQQYEDYFEKHKKGPLICLDKAPRWVVWPGTGTLSLGPTMKHVTIIKDISRHTIKAIYQAEKLAAWTALDQQDLFEMEYWVLEQNKLKKGSQAKAMQGQIALITGAASGIGKACVDKLLEQGAVVAALDINPTICSLFDNPSVLGLECDVTDSDQLKASIEQTVAHFGGLDMLVCNAGVFPKSHTIGAMNEDIWSKSMDINLTSHQRLLKLCLPYLELGINPSVVIIGSKNVLAPGPGAAAYSVAKAGLTQLGRIAAMELGNKGIRVNTLHPNSVYDTGIWTEEILQARANHYGLAVEAYKTNNVLKVEITSADVAGLVALMLGSSFSKITGAQIPIDGGNDRII
jgi:rhamnose utilization protein RhaD (predicted bifunctional aldolase and dehydrogenase)/NAD(P)-dependent dehydrogenase (short-subunit alcohol dehydrogenase family)